jgi:UDP-N-acetylmuramoylalanine--D-glutamate ligase
MKVTVMGLGAFGGGEGITKWLVQHGADVLVTDLKSASELHKSVAQLQHLVDAGKVRLRLGEHKIADFTACDMVVANPAVPAPWDNRFLRAANAAGIPVRSEIGLLVERIPDRTKVVAVTGSAGKSTTSAMIHHALSACGVTCEFGGNVGGSLHAKLDAAFDPRTFIVLELSSFMLHWLHTEHWGTASRFRHALAYDFQAAGGPPHVACVTNLSPNHLDWHASMTHYEQSKKWIVDDQLAGDVALLGPGLRHWSVPPGVDRIESENHRVTNLRLPGSHNQINAGMALLAARAAAPHLDLNLATSALREFTGLPNRLQFVLERDGVRWYNDSKCTTPEACLLGVQSFADADGRLDRVHLIAGGYDKGSDLSPVADLAERLAGLYTIGKTGPAIAAAARGRAIPCETLEVAVARIRERAKVGDIALLSPACASWDQFDNYEERGRQFCDLARRAS